MGATSSYRIEPEMFTGSEVKGPPFSFGCFIMSAVPIFVFALFVFSLATPALDRNFTSVLLALPISVFLGAFMVKLFQRRDYEEAKRHWVEGKRYEAQKLSDEMNQIYGRCVSIVGNMGLVIPQAQEFLAKARGEYEAGAFVPFWDFTAKAAYLLSWFESSMRQLAIDLPQYRAVFPGKRHNFPSIDLSAEDIPDPSTVIALFMQVVRLGRSHYQFATFGERRIDGDIQLRKTIQSIEEAAPQSIAQLRSVLESIQRKT